MLRLNFIELSSDSIRFRSTKLFFISQLKPHSVTWQKTVKNAIGYVSPSIFLHYQCETDV